MGEMSGSPLSKYTHRFTAEKMSNRRKGVNQRGLMGVPMSRRGGVVQLSR